MPNYDASNTNNSKRATRIYKDLDLDFGRNPVTNDVNKLIDQQIRFSKLYHYLECSRYAKKKNRN